MSQQSVQNHGETSARSKHPLKRRTKAYALTIIQLYSGLLRTTVAQVIGKQLLRSGTSVGANYREGARARSSAEMLAKFGICIQELEETAYWLELLIDAGIVAETMLDALLDETNQLTAILVASSRSLNKKRF